MCDFFLGDLATLVPWILLMGSSIVLLRLEVPVVGFLRRHRLLSSVMFFPGRLLFFSIIFSGVYIVLQVIGFAWLKLLEFRLPNMVYLFVVLITVRLIGWTVEWRRTPQNGFPRFIHSAATRFFVLLILVFASLFGIFALGLWPVVEPVVNEVGKPLVRFLLSNG